MSSSLDRDRADLAAAQADLAATLLAGAPVPAAFREGHVKRVRRQLLDKRRRGVQQAFPALAEALGDQFEAAFRDYAESHPLTAAECSHADADRFARCLLAARQLPESALPATLRRTRSLGLLTTAHTNGRTAVALRLGGRTLVLSWRRSSANPVAPSATPA